MRRSKYLLIPLLFLTSSLVKAQEKLLPIVTSVMENIQGTQITINGVGFGTRVPKVALAATPLTVTQSSETSITATLPAGISDGAYLLSVQNTNTFFTGIFEATIGQIGQTGPAGQPGPAGPQGLPGLLGPAGLPGAPGAVGPAGAQGPAGAVGLGGPQGLPGTPGAVGPAGAQGPAGPFGPAGPQGAQGTPGAVGPAGAQGPAGAVGPAGPQGATGLRGLAGPAGAQGATGAAGPAGPQGVAGSAGPSGPAGPAGPIGPIGPSGAGAGQEPWSANILLPASIGGNLTASPVGASNASATSPGDIQSTVVPVPAGCNTVSNLTVTVLGAQGTSTVFVAAGVSTLAEVQGGSANSNVFCQITAANGSPVSCTSSGTETVNTSMFLTSFLAQFSNPSDFQNARVYTSFTCH